MRPLFRLRLRLARRRLELFPFKGSQGLFRVSPRPVALSGQP